MGPVTEALLAMVVAGVFLGPALRWPTAGRALLGLFFLGGALFNLLYTLPHLPASLSGLVATAPVPIYRDVVHAAIGAGLDGVLLLLVVAFEVAAGLLALGRGLPARLALLAAGAWGLGMVPVIPPDGLLLGVALTGAPGLAGLLLARRRYAESVIHTATGNRRPPPRPIRAAPRP